MDRQKLYADALQVHQRTMEVLVRKTRQLKGTQKWSFVLFVALSFDE